MDAIETLLKLEEQALDAIKRELSALRTKMAEFENAISRLDQAWEQEREVAARSTDMLIRGSFSGYSVRVRAIQEQLRSQIAQILPAIEALEERMREHFTTQKTYQQLQHLYGERERVALARAESIELDEIAQRRSST